MARSEGTWQRCEIGVRRKRLFNAAIHTLRDRVERTFAWEDKFKRLLLRFEHIQQRHYGMKLMAYTLINVRHFCGT
jgi:transposase